MTHIPDSPFHRSTNTMKKRQSVNQKVIDIEMSSFNG